MLSDYSRCIRASHEKQLLLLQHFEGIRMELVWFHTLIWLWKNGVILLGS